MSADADTRTTRLEYRENPLYERPPYPATRERRFAAWRQCQLQPALQLSASQIHDVAAQAASITSADGLSVEAGTLSHSATLSLGGGRQPCASLRCRIRHIDELAQFAAFYSDRVYIHNFLSEHAHEAHAVHALSLDELRFTLVDDLEIVARVRPLMEAGLVVPITPSADICHQCVALDAFGANADKRLVRERARLRRRFLTELKVFLEYSDGEWLVIFEGPKERARQFLERLERQPSLDSLDQCFPFQVLSVEAPVEDFYDFYGISSA